MKTPIAALFVLVFLIPIPDAAAGRWCAGNFGDQPDRNCAPTPFQYCLGAMAASAFGGVCAHDDAGYKTLDRAPLKSPARRKHRRHH
jgi:hypothetical protein